MHKRRDVMVFRMIFWTAIYTTFISVVVNMVEYGDISWLMVLLVKDRASISYVVDDGENQD